MEEPQPWMLFVVRTTCKFLKCKLSNFVAFTLNNYWTRMSFSATEKKGIIPFCGRFTVHIKQTCSLFIHRLCVFRAHCQMISLSPFGNLSRPHCVLSLNLVSTFNKNSFYNYENEKESQVFTHWMTPHLKFNEFHVVASYSWKAPKLQMIY